MSVAALCNTGERSVASDLKMFRIFPEKSMLRD